MTQYKAVTWYWAIDLNDTEMGSHLAGVYLVGFPHYEKQFCQALTTALFATRREARDWLRRYKAKVYVPWPKARVVKVQPLFRIPEPPK